MTTMDETAQSLVQDYAITPVPASERRSFLSVSITTGAWVIAMSTLWTGSVLAQGMPFERAVTATIIGMAILGFYGFFQGWLGARYGVSTTVLAREAFGRIGSSVLGVVFALTLGIGWFAWQIGFFGQTLAAMFPEQWFASPWVAMLWGGVLMIATAFIGYRALAFLSMIAVPLILILAVWGLARTLGEAAGAEAVSGQGMSLFEGVAVVVGNAALGAVVFPDLTRYARTPLQGAFSTAGGYMLGGILTILAGAAITAAAGLPDGSLPAAMAAIGMGTFAFLILVFAQWTTNDNNLYTGALGLANVVPVKKAILVLVMGATGLVIALVGIQDFFVPYLVFLGTYVPPIAGVMIADHWVVKRWSQGRDYSFGPGASHAAVNWVALASVVLGGVIGGALGFGIAPINAIVIAFVLHAGGSILLDAVRVPVELGRLQEDAEGF